MAIDQSNKRFGGIDADTGAQSDISAPAQTQTAAFKRWFGDSKVVDVNGNPLMVYHGTKESFSEFRTPAWFTPNRQYADYFSSDWSLNGEREDSSKVVSSYIRIENPVYTSDWDVTEPNAEMLEQFKTWEKQGHDGIVCSSDDEIEYIVFHPSQIKSATGISEDIHMNETKSNPVKEVREHYFDLLNQCLSGHPYGAALNSHPEDVHADYIDVFGDFALNPSAPYDDAWLNSNIIYTVDESAIHIEIDLNPEGKQFFQEKGSLGDVAIKALDTTTDFAKKLLREAHKCDIPLSLSNNPFVFTDESYEWMTGSEIIDEYRQELKEYEKCLKAPAEYVDPLADSAKKDASMKPV